MTEDQKEMRINQAQRAYDYAKQMRNSNEVNPYVRRSVSTMGLFYLVKYLYEGKVHNTELERQLTKLKKLINDDPYISYDKVYRAMVQFETRY